MGAGAQRVIVDEQSVESRKYEHVMTRRSESGVECRNITSSEHLAEFYTEENKITKDQMALFPKQNIKVNSGLNKYSQPDLSAGRFFNLLTILCTTIQ